MGADSGSPKSDNLVPKEHKGQSQDEDADSDIMDNTSHLQKISDFKTYAKGLMDIALLTANANQLRHAFELCMPFRTILIVLLTTSIVLQVFASCLLLVERLTVRKKDYKRAHIYNAAIGLIVIGIILVNVLATAFGGPEDECEGRGNHTVVP